MLPTGVIAPERQTLRFTCRPKLYGIPTAAKPFDGEVAGIRIREVFQPRLHSGLPPDIGDYVITVEKTVGSSDELLIVARELRRFISDLDKCWAYACGEPLEPVVLQLSFDTKFSGWDSNESEIQDYLLANCNQTFAVIKMGPHQHWISMPYFPLPQALHARAAYESANPPTRALVDMHYSALKSRGGEGQLFSFAKGLELLRKVLPGRTDEAKQRHLPKEIIPDLKHSLHWLMGIANNRYNVRHVVAKGEAVNLKPQMTGQEIVDFRHDADLILRAAVCQDFGLICPRIASGVKAHQRPLNGN